MHPWPKGDAGSDQIGPPYKSGRKANPEPVMDWRAITGDYATTVGAYYAAPARHGELNDDDRDGLSDGRR
jgi:hypothetical protein